MDEKKLYSKMTKKAFISAAKYYGLTVSYSGNRKIWFVKRDNTVLQLAGYVVRESKSFTEVMFNHTENLFNTYKKEREKLNGNVPAGTPNTPPNGSNGKKQCYFSDNHIDSNSFV